MTRSARARGGKYHQCVGTDGRQGSQQHGDYHDTRPPNARTLYSLLCRHESRLSFIVVFVFFAFGFIFGFARLWPLAGTRTGIHFIRLFVIGFEL